MDQLKFEIPLCLKQRGTNSGLVERCVAAVEAFVINIPPYLSNAITSSIQSQENLIGTPQRLEALAIPAVMISLMLGCLLHTQACLVSLAFALG